MATSTTEVLRAIGRVQDTADRTMAAAQEALDRIEEVERRLDQREHDEELAAAKEEGRAEALAIVGATTNVVTEAANAATAAEAAADVVAFRRLGARALKWLWPLLLGAVGLGGGVGLAGGGDGTGTATHKSSASGDRRMGPGAGKSGAAALHHDPHKTSAPPNRATATGGK